jgi:pimeloyl-ACP methyl ester carboxylesterase
MNRAIPRFTLEGVTDAEVSVHPFATEDGLGLNVTRFRRADCDDVVLLIHGMTASSDLFIMPEHTNLVSFLLDNGFTDVWVADFRMSGRFPYPSETHRYTMDDIADYDHPATLREIRRHVGDRRIHVFAHCLGSLSFMMSLFGGAATGVTSVTCNSVALTPRVARWSRLKLAYGPAIFEYLLGILFLDPRFSHAPRWTRDWVLSRLVSWAHGECGVRECHMLSFMWGSGHPAMYLHENLQPATHERIADLCGACGMNYFRHIHKMVEAGHAVKCDPGDPRHARLPDDYLANAAKITTPILLLTGDTNHVFGDSNVVCYDMLSKIAPGHHELEIIHGYGHADTIIGKNAHIDVFPRVLEFLKRQAA